MNRLIIFTFAACLASSVCMAQEMTLRQCIDTAIENNLSLDNARIGIRKSDTELSQSRAKLLPIINGVFQITDYLKNPVNVTTGTLLGNDFPDDPTWQTIRSTQYQANAGIQLNMPLYNQSVYAAIDMAKTAKEITTLSYEKGVEDLTVQLSKVYFLAQASKAEIALFDENIKRMRELCEITEAMYDGGVVLEVDLNRVRINLRNIETQRGQFAMLYEQQLNMLRFIMDVEPEYSLDVTAPDEDIHVFNNDGVDTSLPELRITQKGQELIDKKIKTVKAGYLPSIGLTGYAGAIGYQERFSHFFHTKEATQNWFGNCFIGLTVKIPIFEARSKKLQIQQYRHDAMQMANNFELQRKQLNENYTNALLQLNHNQDVFRTQSDNCRQAESVYNVTEEQYREGVASMTALLQDEMQMRSAQIMCVQAQCQYNLARLELLRLSGNLKTLTE